MGHAKRTVDTVAVLERGVERAVVLIMTGIAHIVRTKATEEGSRTTVHTLPVDLVGTMLITLCRSSSYLLKQTVLTHKVLLAGCLLLFGVGSLLFAIDKSAKVGPLAGIALIEGATMVGIFLFFAKIDVIFVAQSFIV